jgi:hypothetical protein
MIKTESDLTSEDWAQLRDEWIGMSEHKDQAVWLPRFRDHADRLMKPEECVALAKLGDPAILYRGTTLEHAREMSWTDDLNRAALFASKQPQGVVITAAVPKRWILACFLEQQENEVVIDPTLIEFEIYSMSAEDMERRAAVARREGTMKANLATEKEEEE